MSFQMHCPKCQRVFEFQDSVVGHQRRCISCGTTFTAVPDVASSAVPTPRKPQRVTPVEETPEVRRSPMPYVLGSAAVIGVALLAYLLVGRSSGGGHEELVERKEATTVRVSREEKLIEEGRALLRSLDQAPVKDAMSYAMSVATYEKIFEVEKGLEMISSVRGEAAGGGMCRELAAARARLEEAYQKFVASQVPSANSLAELHALYAHPQLPQLKEMITATVLRVRPALAHRESAQRLRERARAGTCHEASAAEREAWYQLMRAGDPVVLELLGSWPEEVLALCALDGGKEADSFLPALLRKAPTKALAKQLYASSVFCSGGAPKVRKGDEEMTLAMPSVYQAIVPLASLLPEKLTVDEHAAIIKSVYDCGWVAMCGPRFVELFGINGSDPPYRVKLVMAVIGGCLPRSDGGLPLVTLIEPILKEFSESDLQLLLLQIPEGGVGEHSLEKVIELLERVPVPTASSGLIALVDAIQSDLRLRCAMLLARCYAGGDTTAMAAHLERWAREPLNTWDDLFREFLAHGHTEVVGRALQGMIESTSEEEFARVVRLVGELLSTAPQNAEWGVPALIRSYRRFAECGEQRKSIIVTHKQEASLVEAIQLYAEAAATEIGSDRLGLEFLAVLKALLDKRAVRFLIWVGFEKPRRETWAVAELRRVTGGTGELDVDYWKKWVETNKSKLPPQIETKGMGK